MITHYPLAEAAELICQGAVDDPVQFVRRRIQAGQFKALKFRGYRMTEAQIEDAIKSCETNSATQNVARLGITAASARRRSA